MGIESSSQLVLVGDMQKMAEATAENVRNSMELMDQTDEGENLVRELVRMTEEKRPPRPDARHH